MAVALKKLCMIKGGQRVQLAITRVSVQIVLADQEGLNPEEPEVSNAHA